MLTSHALLVPHLPTLLLDEHRGHRTEMIEALTTVSQEFFADGPVAAVVLSARWESPGAFLVDASRNHRTLTDYSGLGVEVRYDCEGHPALAKALVEAGTKARLRVAAGTHGVDSGVTVPMHFLAPRRELRVVPLSLAQCSPAACRSWGRIVRGVLAAWPERVAIIVGGLLAFDAHASSLRRDVPEGVALDERVLEAFRTGEWKTLDSTTARSHGEAGLRHLEVLRGFAGDVHGEVRCYEAGPGVGAALAAFPTAEPVVAEPDAEESLDPPHAP